jgi:hypothetical protein
LRGRRCRALTIVLAAGLTRGWRSALAGVGVALVVLSAIVAVLGPALTVLPIDILRLVVGGLLLVFGLQWLRKAILRASGFKARHDEEAIFATELAAARAAGHEPRAIDGYGFTLSFKGVLLEGLGGVYRRDVRLESAQRYACGAGRRRGRAGRRCRLQRASASVVDCACRGPRRPERLVVPCYAALTNSRPAARSSLLTTLIGHLFGRERPMPVGETSSMTVEKVGERYPP